MSSNDEMMNFINSVLEELHDPKNVNTFYAHYYSDHVCGLYNTVDEAIRAWHNG